MRWHRRKTLKKSKPRDDRSLTDRIRASLLTMRAQSRVVTIVTLLGISAYFLSVLASIPTTVALVRVLPQTLSSTLSKLLVGTLALDLPKLIVLAAMAYPMGRLLAVRPWIAVLGTMIGIYVMDGAVSWVMGSLDAVWLNRYAAPSRLTLIVVTYLLTWWLAHLGWRSKQKRSGFGSRSETLQDAGHSADSTQTSPDEQTSTRDDRDEEKGQVAAAMEQPIAQPEQNQPDVQPEQNAQPEQNDPDGPNET